MDGMNLFDQYTSMGKEGVIFVFRGSMSQALLVKLGGMIREDLFIAQALRDPRGLLGLRRAGPEHHALLGREDRGSPGGGAGEGSIVVVSESEDHTRLPPGTRSTIVGSR